MTAPLIGLPGRRKKGRQLAGGLESMADFDIDMYFADYARGIIDAGGLPVHIPLDVDAAALIDRLDGLLLTGGADMNPSTYGAELAGSTGIEDIRDASELAFLDGALDRDLPVLGICRGLQVINVHAGGTLHQDIPPHGRFTEPPSMIAHDVVFEAGTTVADLYGERQEVNSLHHQTVDRLGDGLIVSGRAPDGTIEAIEAAGKPVLAVQWHPEMLPTRATDPAFAWLVDAAS